MIKMKYRSWLKTVFAASSLLITCAIPHKGYAQQGFGIGGIVGEPSGVSVKYWIDRTSAFDAAFAWSLVDNSPFQFHADYLMHGASLTGSSSEAKGSLPWYFGFGGRVKNINNESHIGIRVPLGITYLVSDAPLDIFAEISPVLDVTPSVNLNWNVGVGVRFYFH